MKIVCISDTHSQHKKIDIPQGDILIHAGDFTNTGKFDEVESFANWFGNQPHKYKICIAGNHDISLDVNFYNTHWEEFHTEKTNTESVKQLLSSRGILYLQDTYTIIENIKIYGSPYSLSSSTFWAFGLGYDLELETKWKEIPDDTDILITHTPPYGYLDYVERDIGGFLYKEHLGCDILLLDIVERINPRYHIFGHIHSGYGIVSKGNTTYINASLLNENYRIANKPIVIDLFARASSAT